MRENINDGKHIHGIIGRVTCTKHRAEINEPCFVVHADRGNKTFLAICNKRAKLGGAIGNITESSYQVKRSAKKRNG